MVRRLSLAVLTAALLVALAPPAAHAQRELDIERFTPAPDGDGFLGITGTRTPGPWRWNLALWLGYAQSPLTARLADGSTLPLVENRANADLLFQVGLLGRFALVVDVPVVLYQAGMPDVVDGRGPLQSVALRDPRFALRARIFGEDATEERERHEGEGLAVQIGGTAPIGQEQSYAGQGAASLDLQILGDFHILGIGIGGVLGARHRFAEPRILGVPFRNELFFGVGVQVPAFFVDDVVAIAELMVHTDLENAFGNEASTAVDWLLGVRGRVRDLELTLGGGTGLTSGVGTTAFRIVAGMSWAPRVHDRDHDGILDDDDECAALPEDFDGHLDEDGCPEPDNDGDLVPDLDDRCPDDAADFGRDLDDDGCNDAHVDTDEDGIDDQADACPAEPEDVDGIADDDGCPDPDEDAAAAPEEPSPATPAEVPGQTPEEAAPTEPSEPSVRE